jgi:hypothetical protein
MVVLQLHPVADGAEIVAEVQVPGGLDAGEDTLGVGGHARVLMEGTGVIA